MAFKWTELGDSGTESGPGQEKYDFDAGPRQEVVRDPCGCNTHNAAQNTVNFSGYAPGTLIDNRAAVAVGDGAQANIGDGKIKLVSKNKKGLGSWQSLIVGIIASIIAAAIIAYFKFFQP